MNTGVVKSLWSRYFPTRPLCKDDQRLGVVEVFIKFFSRRGPGARLFPLEAAKETESSIYLDMGEMSSLIVATGIDDFADFLRSRPNETIGFVGVALSLLEEEKNRHLDAGKELVVLRPRFLHLGSPTPFENLKVSSVGQLVTVTGHVVRVAPARPFVEGAYFACGGCGQDTWNTFEDGVFQPPTRCSTDHCNKKTFELRREKAAVICDYQRIKVQEPDQAVEDTARVPRTFEVEVRGVDQVDCCVSGDLVEIVGVICTMNVANQGKRGGYGGKKKGGGESALHTMYILANSLVSIRKNAGPTAGAKRPREEEESTGTLPPTLPPSVRDAACGEQFSSEELEYFESVRSSGDPMGMLVQSFCPTIFGHETVKLGLLLGLLGGTHTPNRHVRSDIHVLVVGDPGLGKSQLLRAAANCSPRSVVVCGNTATTAGLTVAVSREDNGEMSLEAGALVLANQGVCCIDELDKMTAEPNALLEAMEQQSISVAKSGVVTSIKCRTSVLAAANPVGGHYNRRKSVGENLKMNAALLSRFDLVFILMDKPDLEKDNMISEHIMRTHQLAFEQGGAGAQEVPHYPTVPVSSSSSFSSSSQGQGQSPLRARSLTQRLRELTSRSGSHPRLSEHMMRRYIDYAKKKVVPKMSIPAAKSLQKLYLTMRAQAKLGDSIPVTTRHLESLIRLSQARARMDLRDSVTADDAQDVIDLLQESLLDAFTNETGQVDLSRKGGGGLTKQVKALVSALTQQARARNNNVFRTDEIAEICAVLKLEKGPEALIETMNMETYLLKKGPRLWELNTVG